MIISWIYVSGVSVIWALGKKMPTMQSRANTPRLKKPRRRAGERAEGFLTGRAGSSRSVFPERGLASLSIWARLRLSLLWVGRLQRVSCAWWIESKVWMPNWRALKCTWGSSVTRASWTPRVRLWRSKSIRSSWRVRTRPLAGQMSKTRRVWPQPILSRVEIASS